MNVCAYCTEECDDCREPFYVDGPCCPKCIEDAWGWYVESGRQREDQIDAWAEARVEMSDGG